jgi:hypothetical protein
MARGSLLVFFEAENRTFLYHIRPGANGGAGSQKTEITLPMEERDKVPGRLI